MGSEGLSREIVCARPEALGIGCDAIDWIWDLMQVSFLFFFAKSLFDEFLFIWLF